MILREQTGYTWGYRTRNSIQKTRLRLTDLRCGLDHASMPQGLGTRKTRFLKRLDVGYGEVLGAGILLWGTAGLRASTQHLDDHEIVSSA